MSKQQDIFKSNPNLKAANVAIEWTQEMIDEYQRCATDLLYFIKNYIKIRTLNEKNPIRQFEPYDFQEEILTIYEKERYVIVKCSRQVGKTTVTCAYITWCILFKEEYSVCILANKKSNAIDILSRVKLSYEQLPNWLQQGAVEWNKLSVTLENGSNVQAQATSGDSGRSGTFNLVILEEFAFVEQTIAEEFYTSIFPTISSSKTSKLFMISTPNGMNHFYKYWSDALKKKNLYIPVEAHWSEVPGRDENWYDEQIAQMGEEKFIQEYGGEFLGSTNTLIPQHILKSLVWEEPISINSGVYVYEHPKKERIYMLMIDPSDNVGQNYSAFSVFDATEMPYKQVARYRSKDIADIIFPSIIKNVAIHYNNAYILSEINKGDKVPLTLYDDLEYENVLCAQNKGRGGQVITLGPGSNRNRMGLTTTHPVKQLSASTMRLLIEKRQLILQDYETISELTTYVSKSKTQKTGSYEAQKGSYDDLIDTVAMFCYLSTQEIFKDLTDVNTRKQIMKERDESENIIPYLDIYDDEETYVESNGQLWHIVTTKTYDKT